MHKSTNNQRLWYVILVCECFYRGVDRVVAYENLKTKEKTSR